MLTPIRRIPPPLVRNLTYTYDGEWVTDAAGRYKLRLLSIFGPNGYDPYTTVESFLDAAFTLPSGSVLWAHNGGAADMCFLLPVLRRKRGVKLTPIYSGSRLIILRCEWGKSTITFADSLPLFMTSLAKLAPAFAGREKSECAFDAPIAELKEYNENDCSILLDSIFALETIWRDKGGALRWTSASSALFLFRARYLSTTIKNSTLLNRLFRPHYYGGRTTRVRCGHFYNVREVDIKSSYPCAMSSPLPGNLLRTSKRIPDGNDPIIVDATVNVSGYLPALPMRTKYGSYYVTGERRGMYTRDDLECAGVTIKKVHEVFEFEPNTDWRKYVKELYDIKKSATKNSGLYEWAKHSLNDPYGKMAQREHQRVMSFTPPEEGPYEIVEAGVYVYNRHVNAPHVWVPMSMTATARGRRRWHDGAVPLGEHLYYGDTDSLHFDASQYGPVRGNELGDWEHSAEFAEARYHGKKLYWAKHSASCPCAECARASSPITVVHAKGMRGIECGELDAYAHGAGYTAKRPGRPRELIRSHDDSPRDIEVTKYAAGPTHPNGLRAAPPERDYARSRAWDVSELRK